MRILVVDDSKTVLYVLGKLLRELGYNDIVEAHCVLEAQTLMKADPPDLIISDMNMPGKTGLDLLAEVRADPNTKGIPFIIVTTEHDRQVVFKAVKAGVQYYIFKPIERCYLVEKLNALSRSHGLQAPRVPDAPQAIRAPRKASEGGEGAPSPARNLTAEQAAEIAGHFSLVVDGELATRDFREWLGREILGLGAESGASEKVSSLLDTMKGAASAAILAHLQG